MRERYKESIKKKGGPVKGGPVKGGEKEGERRQRINRR